MTTTPMTDIQTLVIKIGTTLLSGDRAFDGRLLEAIVKDLARLKKERRINVLIVSSGAIGCSSLRNVMSWLCIARLLLPRGINIRP